MPIFQVSKVSKPVSKFVCADGFALEIRYHLCKNSGQHISLLDVLCHSIELNIRKAPPKPFFEIIYLDHDLRVHKTGQGNVFVQEPNGFFGGLGREFAHGANIGT